jgi:hypothetical protein
LEDIPKDSRKWHPSIRRARGLADTLFASWNDALLFRTLATLRTDAPVFDSLDELSWRGPRAEFDAQCQRMSAPNLLRRALTAAKQISPTAV